MIEDAIRAVLIADSRVSALVGSRIWPLKLPQTATLPAIVYQRISTIEPDMAFDAPAGPVRARVQVTAWADTFDVARQIVSASMHALNGWSGMAGAQTVKLVRFVNWLDNYDPGPPERFGVISDYYVYSMEGVAA